MRSDYLIIGQGVSGTFLSWYLQKAGASVIVIDENKPNTASRVAAGLINPVTGRRLVKSWMIDELMPFAWQAYREIGDALNIGCIRETSLLQFFKATDMQDAFNKKLLEEPEYLSPAQEDAWKQYFNYPFGWGIIAPCYLADPESLIVAYSARLTQHGQFIQDQFDVARLEIADDHIQYKDIRAKKIIFCEGEAGLKSPWFNKLPYSPNKGEALLIRIPDLPAEHIYKFRQTLIPIEPATSLFWFGSNYEWTYENNQPTEQFRQEAEAELKRFLKLPYTFVDHKAAIRSANIERRPFIGLHPRYPQLGILNGLGTKGCSLAPYFANQFAEYLVNNKPLLPLVDVNRHRNVIS